MKNDILSEKDKRFTLEEYIPLASHILTFIASAAESVDEIKETFTTSDLRALLSDMSEDIEGEFKFHQTDSGHYQVVYEPYDDIDAEDFGSEDVLPHHIEPPDGNRSNVFVWFNSEKLLDALRSPRFGGVTLRLYFHLGFVMHEDMSFAVSHHIKFEKIIEICREEGKVLGEQHQTTLMRAIADLEDAGLIKWNSEASAFELLHITSYDPTQTV